MTTIIDSLVVEIGIDTAKLSSGAQAAINRLRDLENSVDHLGDAEQRRAKNTAFYAKGAGDAIGRLKTQALELFAVVSGGRGLIEFVSHLTETDAAVGRVSRSTNLSVGTISKWQGAARILGGDAESMAASFIKMNDAVEGFRHGFGDPQMIATLAGISRAGGTPIDVTKGIEETYFALADNLHAIAQREGRGAAGAIGRHAGLDPAMIDMFIQGREITKKILEQVDALGPATEKSVDAAGELQRRWNEIFLKTEGTGRQVGVIPQILSTADFLKKPAGEAGSMMLDDLKRRYNERGFFGAWWDMLTFQGGAQDNQSYKQSIPGFGPVSSQSEGYRAAIASIESRGSGGYAAVGPVTSSGDRAYGKYQIMGNNIGPWSQAALGRTVSPSEFMSSPSIQDQIFDHRFGQYVRQYGNPQDAASAWLTGRPLSSGANARDQFGTSGASYARRFTENLNGTGGSQSIQQNFGPVTVTGVKDAADFQNKLRDLGLRRAAEANQSPVGGE